jgi:hypothetical protein
MKERAGSLTREKIKKRKENVRERFEGPTKNVFH